MVRRALTATGHDVVWTDISQETGRWVEWTPIGRVIHAMQKVMVSLSHQPGGPADLVVVHGDRHEILAAAVASNVMGVPVAHIGGGDLTEGSQDDCFRHAITKLAHLHFPSNADSADRIVQMGEQPSRVHVTGCPGLDMVAETEILSREDTFRSACLTPCERLVLVVFHPNTLGDTRAEVKALTDALEPRREAIVLCGPNADEGCDIIRSAWDWLIVKALPDSTPVSDPRARTGRVVGHDNLEPRVFHSLMAHADVMVGNSSAGFYEAPHFGIPVVNIGDRQLGRVVPPNVTTVGPDAEMISAVVDQAMAMPRNTLGSSLYGDGHAAARIAGVISAIWDPKPLLRKQFSGPGEYFQPIEPIPWDPADGLPF
jgi:UDP-hydrolysing UDP-N-acetyl-D-glucosamine 2-epimerase